MRCHEAGMLKGMLGSITVRPTLSGSCSCFFRSQPSFAFSTVSKTAALPACRCVFWPTVLLSLFPDRYLDAPTARTIPVCPATPVAARRAKRSPWATSWWRSSSWRSWLFTTPRAPGALPPSGPCSHVRSGAESSYLRRKHPTWSVVHG